MFSHLVFPFCICNRCLFKTNKGTQLKRIRRVKQSDFLHGHSYNSGNAFFLFSIQTTHLSCFLGTTEIWVGFSPFITGVNISAPFYATNRKYIFFPFSLFLSIGCTSAIIIFFVACSPQLIIHCFCGQQAVSACHSHFYLSCWLFHSLILSPSFIQSHSQSAHLDSCTHTTGEILDPFSFFQEECISWEH